MENLRENCLDYPSQMSLLIFSYKESQKKYQNISLWLKE